MRQNCNIEELLSSYQVTEPKEEQIQECIRKIECLKSVKRIQRADTLWYFLEVQIQFMKIEIIFSFCITIALLVVLQVLKSMLKMPYLSDISVGIAPFWAVPMISCVCKSKRDGMLELESSAKLGLERILIVRTILNQALGIVMISSLWMISSAVMESFLINRLLFSLISFEMTSICFLWFGKKSIHIGVCASIGWMLLMWFCLAWENALYWMWKINSMALGSMTVVFIGISMSMLFRYVKNTSLESEELRWSFE